VSRLATRLVGLLRSALRGIVASPMTSAVAVITITITLVLAGAFALLVSNMEALLDEFGDALHVTAFFDDGVAAKSQDELAALARTVEGVESVRIVSKAEALARFRAGVGGGSALLEGLSENPLPASLEITLVPARRSAAGLEVVVRSLTGLPGISELTSGRDWVEGYLRAVALIRGIGFGLGGILALATLFIVASTIRLAVLSRRDEIEILALVGASRAHINAPFLIEGVLQGAAGGGLALLLLWLLFRLVLPSFEFGLALLLGGVAPHFFSAAAALGLIAVGAGLGMLGSAAALAAESRA
jgi:cell division transport system permease protein